jgi:hypothetical protein
MKVDKGNSIVSFAKVVDEDAAEKKNQAAENANPNVGADGNEQMTLV